MIRHFNLRRAAILLVAVGASALVAGCGRTLVFVERDGVNLAVRGDATSSPPIEANFGLNRTVGTIVPPAGQKKDGQPVGEAVSMFAGFQVDNTVNVPKVIDADLTIDTQFASGKAAINVAGNPKVVARIVNPNSVTFSSSDSSTKLENWLMPDGNPSRKRYVALQAWLAKRYPTKVILPPTFLADDEDGEFEVGRRVALKDTQLMNTAP
jgi:hypothetical protein